MIDIDLLIFDLDGTLIDSKEDIIGAVEYTMRKLGVPPGSRDGIISYVGFGMRELIEKTLGPANRRLYAEGLSLFRKHYEDNVAAHSGLYPGVMDVLEQFRDKRKAVVTNRSGKSAEISLKSLGIRKYFETVMDGDDPCCMKPMACPIEKALGSALFRVEKKKALMVGDMVVDVEAGKSAGVVTCAVTYGLGKREDLVKAGADHMIDDITELKKIVR